MKKGLIFLLAGLFLVFSIKTKSNFLLNLEAGFMKHVGHLHAPKKNALPTLQKSATEQESNGESLSTETSDEDISNVGDFHYIFYASVIGLVFLFSKLQNLKKEEILDSKSEFHSIKKFILVRSIRI
jgi:hypothetical protein